MKAELLDHAAGVLSDAGAVVLTTERLHEELRTRLGGGIGPTVDLERALASQPDRFLLIRTRPIAPFERVLTAPLRAELRRTLRAGGVADGAYVMLRSEPSGDGPEAVLRSTLRILLEARDPSTSFSDAAAEEAIRVANLAVRVLRAAPGESCQAVPS